MEKITNPSPASSSSPSTPPTTATETIAIFGATGKTGRHFLCLALKAGYYVRALVRTPKKLFQDKDFSGLFRDATTTSRQQRQQLTVIQGSFSNTEAIDDTINGSQYVVCMAGPPKSKESTSTGSNASGQDSVDRYLMLHFVRDSLLPLLDQKYHDQVKVLLYQAGVFNPVPPAGNNNQTNKLPLAIRIIRFIMTHTADSVAREALLANDAVVELLTIKQQEAEALSKKDNDDDDTISSAIVRTKLAIIITRPANLLEEKHAAEEKRRQVYLVSSPPKFGGDVTYAELAECSLRALKDSSVYGTALFVGP